jgi:7,8-didemethyl-8-hydroxy-5-deazariboflavin synthase CofG subunit
MFFLATATQLFEIHRHVAQGHKHHDYEQGLIQGWHNSMVTVVYTPAYQVYLSKRCAFSCDYCNFPNVPSGLPPSPKKFRAHLRTAQRMGTWQITLTSGEGIERFAEIESTTRYYGFQNWFHYLYELCRLTLDVRGQQPLTPVLDVGPIPMAELRKLAPVVPLMRLLLDSADPALNETVHVQAPQKRPLLRNLALNDVGRAGIPLATGIRVGIGESPESWEEAAAIVNEVQAKHGNVMSFHLVPFVPEKFSKMANHPPVTNEIFQQAIHTVRGRLDSSIALVAEVHHRLALAAESVVAGAFDLGPIRIADSERFDLDMLNAVNAVRDLLERINVNMECTTVLRQQFYRDHRLPARIEENIERFVRLEQETGQCPGLDTPAEGTSVSV